MIKKNNRGSTLVEMLIYMGIFSILLVVFLQIFSMTLDSQKESQNTSSIAQDGKFIIARLSYDIPEAQTIVSPTLGGQDSILQLTKGSDTYTYGITNNNLTLTTGSEIDRLNSANTTVSNISFKRLGNSGGKNTIQVRFTITGIVLGNKNSDTETFQTTIGQR